MMNEKHTCALEIEKRKVVLSLFFDCDLFLQNFSLSIQFVYRFEALIRQDFIPSQPLNPVAITSPPHHAIASCLSLIYEVVAHPSPSPPALSSPS